MECLNYSEKILKAICNLYYDVNLHNTNKVIEYCIELINTYITTMNVDKIVYFSERAIPRRTQTSTEVRTSGPEPYTITTTLLYHCVQYSAPYDIVKKLLELGADPEYHYCGDNAPIIVAVTNSRNDILSLLIQYGAVIDKHCICRALEYNRDFKGFLDVCNKHNKDLITKCAYYSVVYGLYNQFQYILKNWKINVNLIIEDDKTILEEAIRTWGTEVIPDNVCYDIIATGKVDMTIVQNKHLFDSIDIPGLEKYLGVRSWKRRRELIILRRRV